MRKDLRYVTVFLLPCMMLAGCGHRITTESTEEPHSSAEREQITKDFMNMIEEDPELKHLMEESIDLATLSNPDKKTNPVRSLEEYYYFLDWSATCMPWNILDGQDLPGWH